MAKHPKPTTSEKADITTTENPSISCKEPMERRFMAGGVVKVKMGGGLLRI
jgi:hypothetical protein